MQRLNVIDLDHTLLSIDSFRCFILKHGGARVFMPLARRLLRRTDTAAFAREMCAALQDKLEDTALVGCFARSLRAKINRTVWERIQAEICPYDVTLLVSASPEEYVSEFAVLLGFAAGFGTRGRGEAFFHCRAGNKITCVQEAYPPEAYEYHFSISDSRDDLDLLRLFKVGILIRENGLFQNASDGCRPV